ncbi:hypothetical protein ACE939_04055 [Aquimarina sp. W85]|uniref:hypothetical protein n=1 Tax=Aquimarina rhodophyticola TaxID=3342246 RepID=UPI003671AA0A
MNEIEIAKYYFITKINEPEDNSLEFELICGVVSENEEDVLIGDKNLGPARRILEDYNNRYKITFDSYIGYAVLDESYADKLSDNFTGYNPRIYTESNFLNYIKEDTFATKDYPGEFKHYAFLSENHLLNVAAESEPKIEKIK